jgi:hypothetical protein
MSCNLLLGAKKTRALLKSDVKLFLVASPKIYDSLEHREIFAKAKPGETRGAVDIEFAGCISAS